MNSIDLETKIEGLKKAIAEHKDFAGTYEGDLARAEQELKDIDKPELTASQMDEVYNAIDKAICNFDFSDTDNFDIEYGIEYDGKVYCDSHEFRNSDDLTQAIVSEVQDLFAEKLDTTEADNHA